GVPTYGWESKPIDLAPLDALCREVGRASTIGEKLLGLYGAFKPWLLRQYEAYLQEADSILEGPTIRLLETVVQQERHQITDALELANKKLAADPQACAEAEAWQAHLTQLLDDETAGNPVPANLISASDAP